MNPATTMEALVWEGPRRMALREEAVARPGPNEVLLRVEAVGICGSELSGYLGHNSLRRPPLVMGHEFAGTVVAPGERVEAPAPGARVVVNPLLSCGTCRACRHGRENLCSTRALVGAHRPGAFAEFVAVPAAACSPVPDDLDAALASMAEPLACAVRAVRLAGTGLGDRTLVIGAGPIGLLCALLAGRAGARVAISDTNPARLELARQWGVDRVLGADEAGGLREVFGPEGPDAVMDAVGLEATRRLATETVRRGGSVVLVGLHQAQASFDGNELVRNEVTVRGSFAYARADFDTALELLAAGLLPQGDSWMSLRPLAAGAESFAELVDGSPSVLKIVLQP